MSCLFPMSENRDSCPILHDAVGPYPDEVIMAALDRILYYSGATRIYHQQEVTGPPSTGSNPSIAFTEKSSCPCPTPKPSTSTLCSLMDNIGISKRSSHTSLSKFLTANSKNSGKLPATVCTTPKSSSLKSRSTKCTVPTVLKCPHPRTPRVDFAHPISDDRQLAGGPTISERMKKSLSACSAAYRQLRNKLKGNYPDSEQKWLYTRLVTSENGYKVYEVYKNTKKPPHISDGKQPVILFLIMPNGYVMPFETLVRN